jgi:hypothetical protein
MNSRNPIGVVVNIEAELNYWRLHYPTSLFFHRHRPFDDCVAPLKFSYDAYLALHNCSLREALPGLRQRHDSKLADRRNVDWPLTRSILLAVWERMQAETIVLDSEPMPVVYARAS